MTGGDVVILDEDGPARLAAARAAIFGQWPGDALRADLNGHCRAGWTPEFFPRLAALADHGLAQGTWVTIGLESAIRNAQERLFGLFADGDPPDWLPPLVARRVLLRVAEFATDYGAMLEELEPWLRVLAGEHPARAGHGSAQLLADGLSLWLGIEDGDERLGFPVRTWTEQVGPLAALAYAAGLTLHEAAAGRMAGTLDAEGLTVLAGLRGFTLLDATSARV